MNKILQGPFQKIDKENGNPATKAETANNIGGSGNTTRAKNFASSPDHFITPSKNVEDIGPSTGPPRTERSTRDTFQIGHG